jgi:hypothetical protein
MTDKAFTIPWEDPLLRHAQAVANSHEIALEDFIRDAIKIAIKAMGVDDVALGKLIAARRDGAGPAETNLRLPDGTLRLIPKSGKPFNGGL